MAEVAATIRRERWGLFLEFPLATMLGSALTSLKAKAICFLFCFGTLVASIRMSAGLGLALHLAVLVGAHWYMDLIMGVVHMCLDSPGVLHLPGSQARTLSLQPLTQSRL